jgi:membrane protease YdiL (CAAX protease family)
MLKKMPDELAEPGAQLVSAAVITRVAPPWHTLLLTAAVLTVSVIGLRMRTHRATLATHHVREYLLTLAWEWALAAAVLWGLWLRRTPMRTLLGEWQNGARAWLRDAGFALAFWSGSALVLAAVGVLLRSAHFKLPEGTIAALAPGSVGELLLFLLLSLSAGFCEELLFRGYFQQQFSRMARGRVWVGVVASSLLFGFAHLYEGAAGVILISIFGAMFSLLALYRRSLRSGMMAHAWHDGLSGVILFLLQRYHALS